MLKNNDNENLDMLTFQPFGEETLMSNEEELKKTTSKMNIQENLYSDDMTVKANKSKGEKFNGFIIGLIVTFLFIAYDMIKNML